MTLGLLLSPVVAAAAMALSSSALLPMRFGSARSGSTDPASTCPTEASNPHPASECCISPHAQNRNRRQPQDLLGAATEEQPAHSPTSVAADDDEVRIPFHCLVRHGLAQALGG